jgi:cholesterol transport system auxiliary component
MPRVSSLFAALVVALALAACGSVGRSAPAAGSRYDLGAPNAALQGAASTHASGRAFGPFKLLDIGAPAGLDSDSIVYRLDYADVQQPRTYASSRWSATPAQLLTQRLRTLLGARGTVISGGDPVPAPVVRIELIDFEQVFDKPGESRGVVALRATLLQRGGQLSQATFKADAPAPSADAGGGVRALAQASDTALAQLIDWLARQPLVAIR